MLDMWHSIPSVKDPVMVVMEIWLDIQHWGDRLETFDTSMLQSILEPGALCKDGQVKNMYN